MAWFLAPALVKLRAEINAAFPNRDKSSDGTIGDAAHSSRVSDHNPDSTGRVDAFDCDEDLAAGLDLQNLWAYFIQKKDPRISYVIYEGKIVRGYDKPGIPAWKPVPYDGPSPHDHHMHISVADSGALSKASWGITRDVLEGVEVALTQADKDWIAGQLVENAKTTSSWVWTRYADKTGGTLFGDMFRAIFNRSERYLDAKSSETLAVVRDVAGDLDILADNLAAVKNAVADAIAENGGVISQDDLEAALRAVLGSVDE